ncbi:hypothetical protein CKO09_06570 [Chromatium weissei]|nr:hypothetical protein [Chromatium weissei]
MLRALSLGCQLRRAIINLSINVWLANPLANDRVSIEHLFFYHEVNFKLNQLFNVCVLAVS